MRKKSEITKIVGRTQKDFTVQVTIPYCKSMLEFEETIQKKVNEVGSMATGEALEQFDTDGSAIVIGDKKWTTKGKVAKPYQTPYGEVVIDRHVYQSPQGGRTFCPLERDARIIMTATPRFSKILSSKYSEMSSTSALTDLNDNHGRKVAKSFLQNICDAIGAVAFAKEETWSYALPALEKPVHSVSVGLDGTCMLLCEGGYRETMVGTLAFFDKKGERLHTIYTAAAPEYGKETFLSRLENEVTRAKEKYPNAHYIGLSDGAKSNWEFLNKHTDIQILDFWHATEYLGRAAEIMFKGNKNVELRKEWLENACHRLKHVHGGAARLLTELKTYRKTHRISRDNKQQLNATITYFTNQKVRMKYSENVSKCYPIGSGVTEAGCKVIVKQRLGGSGMKWNKRGAAVVLAMRCLNKSADRWNQFWGKIDQYGFPVAA